LASLLAHLELIRFEPDLTSSTTESTAAMGRAVERMRSIVDDPSLLAEVADPDTVMGPPQSTLLPRLTRRSICLA
jgi:hypothetical protein